MLLSIDVFDRILLPTEALHHEWVFGKNYAVIALTNVGSVPPEKKDMIPSAAL